MLHIILNSIPILVDNFGTPNGQRISPIRILGQFMIRRSNTEGI